MTTEAWAEEINKEAAKSVESILAVGRVLQKAKDDLKHGEFCRLFADGLVSMTRRTANRLMSIARNPVLSNETALSHLPPYWAVLDQLNGMPVPVLEQQLADGHITPDMSLRKAHNLNRATKMLLPVVPKPVPVVLAKVDRIAKIRELARDGYSLPQMVPVVGCSVHVISGIVKAEAIDVRARTAGNQRRVDSNRFVEQMALAAESLTEHLDMIRLDELDRARLQLWIGMFTDTSRILRDFIRKLTYLKEYHHDGKVTDHDAQASLQGLRSAHRGDASTCR